MKAGNGWGTDFRCFMGLMLEILHKHLTSSALQLRTRPKPLTLIELIASVRVQMIRKLVFVEA